MRCASTSGRLFRKAIAPAMSFVQPQPNAFCWPSLLAPTAGVVEQDAVAVADQELGVRDGAGPVAPAAVEDEQRRAVARRAIPAREVDAVTGVERDLAVVGARRGADRLAVLVRLGDRRADRHDGVEREQEPDRDGGDAVGPAAPAAGLALAAMQPEDGGGEADQHHAGGEGEDARDVARGRDSAAMCLACRAPLTSRGRRRRRRAPSAPRGAATGRRRPRRAPRTSETTTASRCWPGPTPGSRCTKASSSTWSSATASPRRRRPSPARGAPRASSCARGAGGARSRWSSSSHDRPSARALPTGSLPVSPRREDGVAAYGWPPSAASRAPAQALVEDPSSARSTRHLAQVASGLAGLPDALLNRSSTTDPSSVPGLQVSRADLSDPHRG